MLVKHVKKLQRKIEHTFQLLYDEINNNTSNVSSSTIMLMNKLQTLIIKQGLYLEDNDNKFPSITGHIAESWVSDNTTCYAFYRNEPGVESTNEKAERISSS